MNVLKALSEALFSRGYEAISNFLGYDYSDSESKDTVQNRIDEAYTQMPEAELKKFLTMYGISETAAPGESVHQGTSLAEKLKSVTVSVESLISEKDRRFCEANQAAYEAACHRLRELASLVNEIREEQKNILLPIIDREDRSFYIGDSYVNIRGLACTDLNEEIVEIPSIFIHRIVNYFAGAYRVSLEEGVVQRALLPADPRADRHCTEEAVSAYREKMVGIALKYQDVVSLIFSQLEGESFEDKAMKELKDLCHSAARRYRNGEKAYEIKKNTISFEGGCSADSYFSSMSGIPEFSIPANMAAVFRAANIFAFGTGLNGDLAYPFNILVSEYRVKGSTFDTACMGQAKVAGVRLFKNGRVDLKFATEALAQDFAKEYLGNAGD